MKKLLIIILGMTLFLPVYAQEAGTDHVQIDSVQDTPGSEGEYTPEEQYEQEEGFEDDFELAERKKKDYTRQKWELGLLSNIGVGFDNDIIGTSDIFKKNIVIDVDDIKNSLTDDGAHVNFDLSLDILHLDIKNIAIKGGLWDFGIFINAGGGLGLNIPKSIFTLISEGNIDQDSFSGMVGASGGVFAAAGFSGAAQYEVGGKNLRVGLKPAFFAPLVYIPKSGINYNLDSKHKIIKEGKEEDAIHFDSSGNISVYGPFFGDNEIKLGFDLSLEGEYALFDFLDVGGTFSSIPFIPAALDQCMQYTLIMKDVNVTTGDLLHGDIDDFDFDFEENLASKPIYALRPMRFDVYGKFRPLALNSNNTHNPELLVLIPNIGFSVDFAGEQGFFNTGIAIQTNLNNHMFTASLYNGYEEGSWKHELGIIFNLRAVELHLSAALRSPNFAGAFQGQGFGVNIGMCYGW